MEETGITVDVHQHRYHIVVDTEELESKLDKTRRKYDGSLDTEETRSNMQTSVEHRVTAAMSVEPKYDENDV